MGRAQRTKEPRRGMQHEDDLGLTNFVRLSHDAMKRVFRALQQADAPPAPQA